MLDFILVLFISITQIQSRAGACIPIHRRGLRAGQETAAAVGRPTQGAPIVLVVVLVLVLEIERGTSASSTRASTIQVPCFFKSEIQIPNSEIERP
jgi:hypothetical protein